MYYLNCFYFYSILGFLMESTVFKFLKEDKHSGIFFGPITAVYGVGAVSIILVYQWIETHFKIHKLVKPILYFILFAILLSCIEWLGGSIIHAIFGLDLWDYSGQNFHINKYISLEMASIWGLFSLVFIYFLKPLLEHMIHKIPDLATLIISVLFTLDTCLTLILK